MMVSADEWESLQEKLFWLSQPGIHESLTEAADDIAAGRIQTEKPRCGGRSAYPKGRDRVSRSADGMRPA